MTEEQKNILIAKMIDDPDSLSNKEIETILEDEEIREIYDLSSTLRATASESQEIDIDREWRLFRHRLHPNKFNFRPVMRIAAIFLCILFVGGIAVKLTDRVFTLEKHSNTASIEPAPSPTETILPVSAETVSILPEEKSLPSSSGNIHPAKCSQKIKQKKEASETDLSAPNEGIDPEEYMRILEATMDNELAIANAEIYMEEYQTMRDLIDFPDNFDERLTKIVMNLTMQ